MDHSTTMGQRGPEAFWRHEPSVTGFTRRAGDLTRTKTLSMRDAIFLALGVATMWGVQVATQSKTQSAIENLGTKLDGFVLKQTEHDIEMQRQIDEARRTANLAIVNDANTAKELSELKGFLAGAGIKGAPK